MSTLNDSALQMKEYDPGQRWCRVSAERSGNALMVYAAPSPRRPGGRFCCLAKFSARARELGLKMVIVPAASYISCRRGWIARSSPPSSRDLLDNTDGCVQEGDKTIERRTVCGRVV
ncbi:hypothetical protein KCP78_01750 [Salmonella enterica subsp. enterica]|nr:hypothetical protein KCP78_01750 [Salmonella enterica subsp. enterica]